MSYLRCPNCKADLEESINIGFRLYIEEQMDLKSDFEWVQAMQRQHGDAK